MYWELGKYDAERVVFFLVFFLVAKRLAFPVRLCLGDWILLICLMKVQNRGKDVR